MAGPAQRAQRAGGAGEGDRPAPGRTFRGGARHRGGPDGPRPARTTVREIRRLEILQEGPRVELIVEATAFLKHMVRNIVGTIVEVGHGRRDPESLPVLLDARDRARAGPTAPAHGLLLDEVFY